MTAPAPSTIVASTSGNPAHEIRTDSLVKTFGERRVVDGVNIRFAAGEVVGLLGPNGAGKTTTLPVQIAFVSSPSLHISMCSQSSVVCCCATACARAVAVNASVRARTRGEILIEEGS